MGSTFSLKKMKLAPFEPMKHAHLKYVTWKTAFLIAITSFRRCSDLQALCIGEESVVVQKGCGFYTSWTCKARSTKTFWF
jgi:hypothetical protein